MQILNIEIKSRARSLPSIRNYLLQNNAQFIGTDHQVDIYFNCHQGRLKLRKGNIENALIFYERENLNDAKSSKIILQKFAAQNEMENILAHAVGVLCKVTKSREIYFIENVKFHLDTILGLGEFVEIECIADNHISHEDQDLSRELSALQLELRKQCDFYIQELKLNRHDFISHSYSDLIIEKIKNFKSIFYEQAQQFMIKIEIALSRNFNKNFLLDHLCYRVDTIQLYEETKNYLTLMADLLAESSIGGRLISIWKLHHPIKTKARSIHIIELPQPKKDNKYPCGFEHAEFVIEASFSDFMQQNNHLTFDTSSITKSYNPELRFFIDQSTSIKFHHQSLENIILQESKH